MLAAYEALMRGFAKDYPLAGLSLFHHRNLRRAPMSFIGRPSLIEMMTDFPVLEGGADICKGTQTMATETLIQMMFWEAGWRGRIVGYVMSTAGLRGRFVKNRINPLLMDVPAYRSLVPVTEVAKLVAGASSFRSKVFGTGQMIFLGSNTATDFVEFSCDTMIIDEFDLGVQENLAMAIDRLREGVEPRIFRLGNPDAPRRLIHGLWMAGDKRLFHFKCGKCNEWQPVDWYVNVVDRDDSGNWTLRDRKAQVDHSRDAKPMCRRCRQFFDRADLGVWVPEQPDKRRRSYLMSRMDSLHQGIRPAYLEFMDAVGNTTKMVKFHRGMLGQPWEGPDQRFTDELLMSLCEGQPEMVNPDSVQLDENGDNPFTNEVITAGVDVGRLFHIQVSMYVDPSEESSEVELDLEDGDQVVEVAGEPFRRRVFVGTRRHEEEVLGILEAFQVDTCVIDANPETRIAKKIQRKAVEFGCVVWLCTFHKTDRVGDQDFGLKANTDANLVQVDRTQTFDAAFTDARLSRARWPIDAPSVLGWLAQMKEPSRQFDEEKGRFLWTKGVDHFHLANVYDTVAAELEQMGGGFFSLEV